jgi:hypothetical protein
MIPSLPAQAHPPHQSTNEYDGHLIIGCKGFSLREDFAVTVHKQKFFDAQGRLVRTVYLSRWEGVITNRATGEFVATDPGHWMEVHNGETVAIHGLLYNIKISSLGIFVRGVGTLVTDEKTGDVIFQSSTDDHHQGYADLCAALS